VSKARREGLSGNAGKCHQAMTSQDARHDAQLIVTTGSAEATRRLAARLGLLLRAGDFIALVGLLGAGKTCFVQGLAEGMGVEGRVTSPTFVLMRLHGGEVPLCHADAYRLESAEELLELGLDDWLDGCVVALEWADRVEAALPAKRIEVRIDYEDEGRRLKVLGIGVRPRVIVEGMRDEGPGD
jgi:tRNA threonylcarbamoyladenosine biosynthesis protein TsaE